MSITVLQDQQDNLNWVLWVAIDSGMKLVVCYIHVRIWFLD